MKISLKIFNLPGTINVCNWLSFPSCTSYLIIYCTTGRSSVSDDCTKSSTLFDDGFRKVTLTFLGGCARCNVNECRPTRGFNARHSKLRPKSASDGVY